MMLNRTPDVYRVGPATACRAGDRPRILGGRSGSSKHEAGIMDEC